MTGSSGGDLPTTAPTAERSGDLKCSGSCTKAGGGFFSERAEISTRWDFTQHLNITAVSFHSKLRASITVVKQKVEHLSYTLKWEAGISQARDGPMLPFKIRFS